MNDTDEPEAVRTRRDCLKYGGTVVGGGLLAGCTGNSVDDSGTGPEDSTTTPTETPTGTPAETETSTETETTTPEDRPYTVSLSPVGEVTFESVPQNAFTVFPWYADMALALGHGDSINSLWWGQGFGGAEFERVDFEALLEADPDVLLTLWGMTSNVDFEALRQNLEDHSVGRELAAVQNDRVYTQGTRFQGPLMNLFQLEMTAKQLYPERFGEWPGYVDGEPYPDLPEEDRLFDRQRVADVIAGDI